MMVARWVALFALVLAGVAAFAAGPDKIKVVLLPIQNTSDPKFANVDKQAVRAEAVKVAIARMRKALEAADYEVPSEEDTTAALKKLDLDFSKPKDRGLRAMSKVGAEFGAGFVILAWITDVKQENLSVGSILNNLGGPASSTKTTVRVWLLDVPAGRMDVDGKAFEAEAKGPRLGTTKRDELSGNPQDVAYSIMQENKRRAEWTGRAAFLTLVQALGGKIGIQAEIKGS